MSTVNRVTLLGRLGKDPELRYTGNKQAVAKFSIATSEDWTDKEGKKQRRVDWHSVVVWGKLGELCNQYLRKGSQAYLEGKLQTRSWKDKNDKTQYVTEVIASEVKFLGNSDKQNESAEMRSTLHEEADVPSDW